VGDSIRLRHDASVQRGPGRRDPAALTGAMILLFLGSWRSTLIHHAVDPAGVLAALTGLSLLGETINVMTLGWLALAVYPLDDATVTIENITGISSKARRSSPPFSIAQQIVVPATCRCFASASPSCRCSGLAASRLSVPAARRSGDAGARGLLLLSRTLVRTLATICAQSTRHGSADEAGHAKRAAIRSPLPARLRAHVRNVRKNLSGLLQLCPAQPDQADRGSFASACCHSALRHYLGQDFFPTWMAARLSCISGPHERGSGDDQLTTGSELPSTASFRPTTRRHRSNIGLSVSGITCYNNSGTIGVATPTS